MLETFATMAMIKNKIEEVIRSDYEYDDVTIGSAGNEEKATFKIKIYLDECLEDVRKEIISALKKVYGESNPDVEWDKNSVIVKQASINYQQPGVIYNELAKIRAQKIIKQSNTNNVAIVSEENTPALLTESEDVATLFKKLQNTTFADIMHMAYVASEKFRGIPVTLVFGETGSGKSTFINFVAGATFSLNEVEVRNGVTGLRPVIVSGTEHTKIGHKGSETFNPVLASCRELNFVDMMGFGDRRIQGAEYENIRKYISLTNRFIIEKAIYIQSIVLVIPASIFDDTIRNSSKDPIDVLVTEVEQFMDVATIQSKSISLVVTRTDSNKNTSYYSNKLKEMCKQMDGEIKRLSKLELDCSQLERKYRLISKISKSTIVYNVCQSGVAKRKKEKDIYSQIFYRTRIDKDLFRRSNIPHDAPSGLVTYEYVTDSLYQKMLSIDSYFKELSFAYEQLVKDSIDHLKAAQETETGILYDLENNNGTYTVKLDASRSVFDFYAKDWGRVELKIQGYNSWVLDKNKLHIESLLGTKTVKIFSVATPLVLGALVVAGAIVMPVTLPISCIAYTIGVGGAGSGFGFIIKQLTEYEYSKHCKETYGRLFIPDNASFDIAKNNECSLLPNLGTHVRVSIDFELLKTKDQEKNISSYKSSLVTRENRIKQLESSNIIDTTFEDNSQLIVSLREAQAKGHEFLNKCYDVYEMLRVGYIYDLIKKRDLALLKRFNLAYSVLSSNVLDINLHQDNHGFDNNIKELNNYAGSEVDVKSIHFACEANNWLGLENTNEKLYQLSDEQVQLSKEKDYANWSLEKAVAKYKFYLVTNISNKVTANIYNGFVLDDQNNLILYVNYNKIFEINTVQRCGIAFSSMTDDGVYEYVHQSIIDGFMCKNNITQKASWSLNRYFDREKKDNIGFRLLINNSYLLPQQDYRFRKSDDVESTNARLENSLVHLIKSRRYEQSQSLIKQGCNINACDEAEDMKTPLHLAIDKSWHAGVEMLVNAKNINLLAQDKNGNTALHSAIFNDDVKSLELLLSSKYIQCILEAFKLKNHDGLTSLELIVKKSTSTNISSKVISFFTETNSLDLNLKSTLAVISTCKEDVFLCKNENNENLLHQAITNNNLVLLQLIVESDNAIVHKLITNKEDLTPLALSAICVNLPAVMIILKNISEIDFLRTNSNSLTIEDIADSIISDSDDAPRVKQAMIRIKSVIKDAIAQILYDKLNNDLAAELPRNIKSILRSGIIENYNFKFIIQKYPEIKTRIKEFVNDGGSCAGPEISMYIQEGLVSILNKAVTDRHGISFNQSRFIVNLLSYLNACFATSTEILKVKSDEKKRSILSDIGKAIQSTVVKLIRTFVIEDKFNLKTALKQFVSDGKGTADDFYSSVADASENIAVTIRDSASDDELKNIVKALSLFGDNSKYNSSLVESCVLYYSIKYKNIIDSIASDDQVKEFSNILFQFWLQAFRSSKYDTFSKIGNDSLKHFTGSKHVIYNSPKRDQSLISKMKDAVLEPSKTEHPSLLLQMEMALFEDIIELGELKTTKPGITINIRGLLSTHGIVIIGENDKPYFYIKKDCDEPRADCYLRYDDELLAKFIIKKEGYIKHDPIQIPTITGKAKIKLILCDNEIPEMFKAEVSVDDAKETRLDMMPMPVFGLYKNVQLLPATLNYNHYDYKGIHLMKKHQAGDGNCLFHSFAEFKVFYKKKLLNHKDLRELACSEIENNKDRYKLYFDDNQNINDYCKDMRIDRTWGTYLEAFALSKALTRQVIIFEVDNGNTIKVDDEKNIGQRFAGSPPILLIFNGNHYDSLVFKGGTVNDMSKFRTLYNQINNIRTNSGVSSNNVKKPAPKSRCQKPTPKSRYLMKVINNKQGLATKMAPRPK